MSLVNGKSAYEWIEKHRPENGWFRVYYKDSLKHDSATMTTGQQLRWEWKYKDGKRADGVSKGWYPKGNIKQIIHYKNGVKHGKLIRYYNDGQVLDEFNYKNGLRHGTLKTYFINGKIMKQSIWDNGELVKHKIHTDDVNKISYILVWADTNSLNRIDPNHYEKNKKVDDELLKHTLELIQQILEMNPHEILIMDNEGNFPKQDNPLIKVIPSYQTYDFSKERPDWLNKINIDDYYEDKKMNHAKCLAMAYNHGIIESSGDYLVLQHNDTKYLPNFSMRDMLVELISKDYEYITIDKKQVKLKELKKYEYFADCYWFLCRKDFYLKHNIWVDWIRGDNNHLATITCFDKGLKYLHLPGFFENDEHDKYDFNRKYGYDSRDGNVHIFNDKPFIIHRKGGTGLHRVLEEKR